MSLIKSEAAAVHSPPHKAPLLKYTHIENQSSLSSPIGMRHPLCMRHDEMVEMFNDAKRIIIVVGGRK